MFVLFRVRVSQNKSLLFLYVAMFVLKKAARNKTEKKVEDGEIISFEQNTRWDYAETTRAEKKRREEKKEKEIPS